MVHDPSLAEISRRLDGHGKALDQRVRSDLYERDRQDIKEDIASIRSDIADIRSRQKDEMASRAAWTKLIVGTLITSSLGFLGVLMIFLLQSIGP